MSHIRAFFTRTIAAGLGGYSQLFMLVAFTTICGPALLTPCSALALPEGRHYEMVSPPYKGAYGVFSLEGVAVAGAGEGDSVVFHSLGVFAGEPNSGSSGSYIARREVKGWSTEALLPPAGISPASVITQLSPTLESSLFVAFVGPNNGFVESLEGTEAGFLLHGLNTPEAPYEVAGILLKRLDGKHITLGGSTSASADLCRLVFYLGYAGEEEALLPDAKGKGTTQSLYELVAGSTAPGCGSQSPSLRLVGVNNKLLNEEPEAIDPHCPVYLGANSFTEGNAYNAVSADGSEIFFTTNANRTEPYCDGNGGVYPGNPAILYVRLGGERTLEVSTPIAADCQSGPCKSAAQMRAEFVGANEAGTKVFFMTSQPLVTGDTDTSENLYMAVIGCPPANSECEASKREVTSLVQVSHVPNAGEAAEVQGVSVVSADGARVYFVARDVLSEGANAEGNSPVKGADNLYVYDTEEETTHFIADLCSGPGLSGGNVEDRRCPDNLEQGEAHEGARTDKGQWTSYKELQTTGNGAYLVFSSFGQLIDSGPQADTDTARDVYRYDALAETLDRVSIGQEGYDANGNNNSDNAEIPVLEQGGPLTQDDEMSYRAISEDGSRIVFETADPLSPDASNGLTNAYEWHKEPGWSEGRVSLVSSGSDEQSVGLFGEGMERAQGIVITPSGRDIFFQTVQGLLPQDTDGAKDVYDARLGSGFPAAPAPLRQCSGEACYGPLTNPAPLLVPGSVVQAPGENLTAPAAAKAKPKRAKTKQKPKKKSKAKVKRAAHGGTANRERGDRR